MMKIMNVVFFLGEFDKINCVRIKLLLIILCGKATHHILKRKKSKTELNCIPFGHIYKQKIIC